MKIHHLGFDAEEMRRNDVIARSRAEPTGDMVVPLSRLPTGEVADGDLLCIESLDATGRPTGPAIVLGVTGIIPLEQEGMIQIYFCVHFAIEASSPDVISRRGRFIGEFNASTVALQREMLGNLDAWFEAVDIS